MPSLPVNLSFIWHVKWDMLLAWPSPSFNGLESWRPLCTSEGVPETSERHFCQMEVALRNVLEVFWGTGRQHATSSCLSHITSIHDQKKPLVASGGPLRSTHGSQYSMDTGFGINGEFRNRSPIDVEGQLYRFMPFSSYSIVLNLFLPKTWSTLDTSYKKKRQSNQARLLKAF